MRFRSAWILATTVAAGVIAIGVSDPVAGQEAGDPPEEERAVLLGSASAGTDDDAAESDYAGDETCWTCHEDLREHYRDTIHAKVFTDELAHNARMRRGCEGCHGPAAEHVESGGGVGVGGLVTFRAESASAIEQENDTCLTCHARGDRVHWEGSPHESREVACTSCHVVMESRSDRHQLAAPTQTEVCTSCHIIERGQLNRNHHHPIREGFLECSSCHEPHGTVSEALIKADTVNDNCYSCHADKRGPFLWEHAPVTESCLNCHEPHGSTRDAMLKLSVPRLCQQCHIASLHPSDVRSEGDRFVIGRSCISCHQSIHGSNHPSGFGFTR